MIELKTIVQHEEGVHEFIDVMIAEFRRCDKVISWEEAKRQLKKKGRL